MAPIVAPHRREYVRAHPVVLWFSVGVAIVGALSLLAPSLTTGSAEFLPEWTQYAFNTFWVIGGTASVVGIVRGLRHIEAFGMTLLCSGLTAYIVILASYLPLPHGITSLLFIAALAVGCGFRALALVREQT